GDLLAQRRARRALVLAELLADRVQLAAEEELALLLLRTALDVLADPLADLELDQPRPLQLERAAQALGAVERREQVDLLLEREIRRVARRGGERARRGDAAEEGGE